MFVLPLHACGHDGSDGADTSVDATTEVGDTEPDARPEVADAEQDAKPEVADTEPDATPEVADTEPDATPDVADAEPDVADAEPDATPDVADVEPDTSTEGTTSQGWVVTAHTPELAATGDMVTGSMTFTRSSGAETRGGGVCLVADLHDAIPCETREDCVAALPPFSEDYFLGGFYYCAAAAEDVASRCWTRPGSAPAYCTRGSAHEPGTITTPAVPALVGGEATLWMSYACMADEANSAGCAGTENVLDLSPTLFVSP